MSHSGTAVVPADCYADAQEPVSPGYVYFSSTQKHYSHSQAQIKCVLKSDWGEIQGFSLSSSR